jgi:hypothetical protein
MSHQADDSLVAKEVQMGEQPYALEYTDNSSCDRYTYRSFAGAGTVKSAAPLVNHHHAVGAHSGLVYSR